MLLLPYYLVLVLLFIPSPAYYAFDVIIKDEPDDYKQDIAITQAQTKEERQAKAKKTYIGNGRVVFRKDAEGSGSSSGTSEDNELPF